MPGLDFLVLFGLSFVFIPCKGVITAPPDMTEYTFLPGQTVNITWVFNDVISTVLTRAWSLTSDTGPGGILAEIYRENEPSIRTKLYDVDIVEPATLVLKNVNQSYNGIYIFRLTVSVSSVFVRSRSVRVFIASKPVNTAVKFSTKSVEISESVTIMCSSDGFPEPRFTIFHNDTKVVNTEKTYTICKVTWNDAGTYKCFARNKLGNDSAFADLTVNDLPEPIATTCRCTSPTQLASTQSVMKKSMKNGSITSPKLTTSVESESEASEECNCSITEWHVIVISLVSGMIIGILLCYTVSFFRRKFGIEKHRPSNPNPSTSQVDSTYQELDLAKINKEDNYQSLRGNAANNVGVNGDDSTYTELSKTRDVENNYQSLT